MAAGRLGDGAYLAGGIAAGLAVVGAAAWILTASGQLPQPETTAPVAERVATVSPEVADPVPADASGSGGADSAGDGAERGSAGAEVAARDPDAADGPVDDAVASGGDANDADGPPRAEPRLQNVRVEPDGLAIIAGRATPFADVVLRADGEVVARASADEKGEFATVATLAPSIGPQVLTLSEVTETGEEIASRDELILAPVQAVADTDRDRAVALSDVGQSASRDGGPAPPTDEPVAQVAETSGALDVADAGDNDAPEREAAREPALTTTEADDPPAPTARIADAAAEPGAVPTDDGAAQAGAETTLAAAPEVATTAEGTLATAPDGPATAGPGPGSAPPASSLPEAAAPDRVAVLRSDAEGVSVMRPASAAPVVMDSVALDTIGYSSGGEVEVQGRAQETAEAVRIYLDNRAVATLPVDADGGWRGALPDVDAGVYTLRIDEVDEAGRVTSRVETPFKREEPEILAAATQNPGARVSAVTVQKGDTLWAISRDRYGEGVLYVRVFDANRDNIRDPDLIYPGQVFALPDD